MMEQEPPLAARPYEHVRRDDAPSGEEPRLSVLIGGEDVLQAEATVAVLVRAPLPRALVKETADGTDHVTTVFPTRSLRHATGRLAA